MRPRDAFFSSFRQDQATKKQEGRTFEGKLGILEDLGVFSLKEEEKEKQKEEEEEEKKSRIKKGRSARKNERNIFSTKGAHPRFLVDEILEEENEHRERNGARRDCVIDHWLFDFFLRNFQLERNSSSRTSSRKGDRKRG